MKKIFLIPVLAVCCGFPVHSQSPAADLSGTWQGTLHVGAGLRTVVKVTGDGSGGWKGEFYSIDQSPNPLPLDTITLHGTDVSFELNALQVKYHGTISADGKAIKGTVTQGTELPLDFERATPGTEWTIDSSPHKAEMIEVEKNVRLEVLDWGGEGRPLVLLAGLGNDAHVFDKFAPKLTAHFHVYGITRRGYGNSSKPAAIAENYSAERLGDDVLAVLDTLKIEKPILAGHSIAGEELSSIGTRSPQRVAGLVYLDAGYPYAYYDPPATRSDMGMDWNLVRLKMSALYLPVSKVAGKAALKELVEQDLPRLEQSLKKAEEEMLALPDSTPDPQDTPEMRTSVAVMLGEQIFTGVKCPVLAIFAVPHDFGKMPEIDEQKRATLIEKDKRETGAQADAFAHGNPQARVVRLAGADHFVFNSNEADVIHELDLFAAQLK